MISEEQAVYRDASSEDLRWMCIMVSALYEFVDELKRRRFDAEWELLNNVYWQLDRRLLYTLAYLEEKPSKSAAEHAA